MERGRLRRIFGKVAAVIAVAATFAFYGLGAQIGHAYYQEWQQNKTDVVISQTMNQPRPTENLPWAATGVALVGAYGMGAAAIAAGKRKDRGYSGGGYSSGYNNSSSNDGFFWGYMWGSSGRSGGSSSSSGSSKDNGGAAAAVVIIGAVALAAGASVVAYKAVKSNFFTGEEPLKDEWKWKTEVTDAPIGAPLPTNANQIPETTSSASWPPVTQPTPEISEPGGKKAKPFSL
ncbi:MAG: hypothetical protein ACAH80_07660 [Alphaproteobacteria bacterium]